MEDKTNEELVKVQSALQDVPKKSGASEKENHSAIIMYPFKVPDFGLKKCGFSFL